MWKRIPVRQLREVAQGFLVLLAAALPFERIDPLVVVGPLQISSVELFLYAAVASWSLAAVAGVLAGDAAWWRRAIEPHVAVAAWAVVLVLSAAFASPPRASAIKFTLRSLGGLMLFTAAADLLTAPGAVRRTLAASAAGALAAAALMIAELLAPSTRRALRGFHVQTFQTLGLMRASGPFQYSNIGSMYLEAVGPAMVALGCAAISARLRAGAQVRTPATAVRVVALGVAIAVLFEAILLSESRAGLVTAWVVVVGFGLSAALRARTRVAVVVGAAGGVAILMLAGQLSGAGMGLRLRFWQDADWYRAIVRKLDERPRGLVSTKSMGASELEVRNDGVAVWRRSGPRPVTLGYHWIDEAGEMIVVEGQRTLLSNDIPPGGRAVVEARFRTPGRPGRYVLWWDLCLEDVTWFSSRGEPGLREVVEVRGAATGPRVVADGLPPPLEQAPVPRRELWRAGIAAWREHPLLGLGPDNFRHVYGRYLGLAHADDRMHANNLYVETLANMGVAGVWALLLVIAALARAVRRAAAVPATRLLALGVGAGLAAYAIHGLLDYFLEFTPTYALLWLLAGAVVALGSETAADAPAARGPA